MTSMKSPDRSVRDHYTGQFALLPIEGGTQILFAGAVLVTIENDPRLPDGLHMRLVRLVIDNLKGRQTQLWDEQAIYGDRPRDRATVKAMALAWADHEADERERRIQGEPPQAEIPAGSISSDPEPDPTGHA